MALALPALLQGGGAFLGALGGIFGKKPKPHTLNLAKLRRDAKANGFNPLTVLRTTGGSGFHDGGSAGGASVLAHLGQGLGAIGSIVQASEDRALATREAEARIASMEHLTASRVTSQPQQTGGRRIAPLTTTKEVEEDRSPYFGVDTADIPYEEVRAMNGQMFRVRADILHAINRKPGDTLVTEDFEAITGEIGGEIHGISSVIDDGLGIGDPWMITTNGRTPAEKEADKANPANKQWEGGVTPMRLEVDPPASGDNTLDEEYPWDSEWR